MYNTQQMFALFSYDFIHDNPFISNYVKKEYASWMSAKDVMFLF